MGYLNNQLEKKAVSADQLSTAILMTSLGGGAVTGALNSEKGNQLASTLGGITGGYIGGVGGGFASLPIANVINKLGLLRKHKKLAPWFRVGASMPIILGLSGAGAYTGSELAKKLKNTLSE